MERLTNKREADAQRKEYENRIRNGYPRNIPEERFFRLAAYEDSDLMPEEITKIREESEEGCIRAIARTFGVDTRRLRELAAADRLGRVVVLPCKVGDTLYYAPQWYAQGGYGCEPILVEKVSLCGETFDVECYLDPDTQISVCAGDFGKIVFFTSEEAEAALKGAENERG